MIVTDRANWDHVTVGFLFSRELTLETLHILTLIVGVALRLSL